MKILIENQQNKFAVNRRRIRRNMTIMMRALACDDKEISLTLVDDKTIHLLNKQYLGRDKATNVLSFSLQEGEFGSLNPAMLGDIVISVETAKNDAAAGGLTLDEEIDFLTIHGLLHLLGYNHEGANRAQTDKMRSKEKELFRFFSNTELSDPPSNS